MSLSREFNNEQQAETRAFVVKARRLSAHVTLPSLTLNRTDSQLVELAGDGSAAACPQVLGIDEPFFTPTTPVMPVHPVVPVGSMHP